MVLLGAAAYAVVPPFAKIAYSHGADVTGVLASRFVMAAPVLIALVFFHRRGFLRSWRSAPLRAAAVPVAVYQVHTFCFFASLERMDAVVAILVVFSYPLMVAVAGAVFLREPLTSVSGALIAAGTVGVYLSVGLTGGASASGVLLAVAAAVLFAWYFMGAKRVLEGGTLDGLTFSALTCCVSAVVFAVVAVVGGASLPNDGLGWSAVLGVAVLGTVAGAALLFTGLGHLDAATAAMLSAAEPPFAVVLAALLLDEPVAAIQILGMAIVAISLTGLSYRATRPP